MLVVLTETYCNKVNICNMCSASILAFFKTSQTRRISVTVVQDFKLG